MKKLFPEWVVKEIVKTAREVLRINNFSRRFLFL